MITVEHEFLQGRILVLGDSHDEIVEAKDRVVVRLKAYLGQSPDPGNVSLLVKGVSMNWHPRSQDVHGFFINYDAGTGIWKGRQLEELVAEINQAVA